MKKSVGVLLLHGLTGVPSEMRPIEKYLKNLGLFTLAPLIAGHGGTHQDLMAVTWKDWVSSCREALLKLEDQVDEVVIIGQSMGASIGGIIALDHPKVKALVMLSPTLVYDGSNLENDWRRIFKSQLLKDILHVICTLCPFVSRRMYWTESPPYGLKDERLQRQVTRSIEAARRGENTKFGLFRTYWENFRQMNFLTDEFRRQAPKLRCPLLAISSLEDTMVSLSNATNTYKLFGSKVEASLSEQPSNHQLKRMVLVTGCDHVLSLDLKRNYVCRLLGEFINDLNLIESLDAPEEEQPGLSLEVESRGEQFTLLARADEKVYRTPTFGFQFDKIGSSYSHETAGFNDLDPSIKRLSAQSHRAISDLAKSYGAKSISWFDSTKTNTSTMSTKDFFRCQEILAKLFVLESEKDAAAVV